MKISRNDVVLFGESLKEFTKTMGPNPRFAYALSKNIAAIERIRRDVINSRAKASDEINAYYKERLEASKNYAVLDEKGNVTYNEEGNLNICPELEKEWKKFNKELKEKHSKAITQLEENEEAFIKTINEVIDFEFYKIKSIDDLPSSITAENILDLEYILDLENGKDLSEAVFLSKRDKELILDVLRNGPHLLNKESTKFLKQIITKLNGKNPVVLP